MRQKPKAVRQRVAFLTALSFTLLVGGVWTLTLPARFSSTEALAQSEGTKPFAGLWTGFRDQFSNLRQQAGAIVSTMPTTTPATTSPEMIDIRTLISTSTEPTPVPTPILIGTTSASTTTQ
ncbi:MAG: hypothetical protein ACK4SL_02600 [Candidatus Paceibacteria bacterium]